MYHHAMSDLCTYRKMSRAAHVFLDFDPEIDFLYLCPRA